MTDQLDAPDVREWLHDTLLDTPPALDVDAVMREGRHRRRRTRISLAVGAAAAVAAVGVLVPLTLSNVGDQTTPSVPVVTSPDQPSPDLPSPTGIAPTAHLTSMVSDCRVRDLSWHLGRTEGTTGTFFHTIRITTDLSHTCRLDTSVEVAWFGGDLGKRPDTVGLPVSTYAGDPHVVTATLDTALVLVHPGRAARLIVAVPDPANFDSSCRAVTPDEFYVDLSVSDGGASAMFPWHDPICSAGQGTPAIHGFHH